MTAEDTDVSYPPNLFNWNGLIRRTLGKIKTAGKITDIKKPHLKSKHRSREDETNSSNVSSSGTVNTGPPLPSLPVELWRRIFSFVVRLPGVWDVDRQDPFENVQEPPSLEGLQESVFEDSQSLLLVCASWSVIVSQILSEHLVIYNENQLSGIVESFERSKEKLGGKGLGDHTRRIDFRMGKPQGVVSRIGRDNIIRLLRCTPNLATYINSNGNQTRPQSLTSSKVVESLVASCGQSLRRVEWNCIGEAPLWADVEKLLTGARRLQTLRLSCIYSFPLPPQRPPGLLTLPNLKTLSLGLLPLIQTSPTNLLSSWDPFLTYFSASPNQLPCLERFEIHSHCDVGFFYVHGQKIRHLQSHSWSTLSALDFCPNLHSLVLSVYGFDAVFLPTIHPNLERICIIPSSEGPPEALSPFYMSSILDPLDALLMMLEGMDIPKLRQIRFRNVGTSVDLVELSVWLELWWRRWNIRGVVFEDQMGRSFKRVVSDEDQLLDSLRG